MKRTVILIWAMVAIVLLALAFGLWQNYQSDAFRGCVAYDASEDWIGYNCKDRPGFYVSK